MRLTLVVLSVTWLVAAVVGCGGEVGVVDDGEPGRATMALGFPEQAPCKPCKVGEPCPEHPDCPALPKPPGVEWCGDGVVSTYQFPGGTIVEACDGSNLAGQTCASLGLGTGILSCGSDCKLDTSGCKYCGDGVVGAGEACDGSDLGGATCSSVGFTGGVLSCSSGCQHDTSSCSLCGDGVVAAGEACDGSDFGGKTCSSLGFSAGILSCAGSCTLDKSGCTLALIQVSAGREHTCGIRTDGTLTCWGRNDYGQASPPAGTFKQVDAGERQTCGVTTKGLVKCWGSSSYSPPSGTFIQVATDQDYSCGIRSNGSTTCWGQTVFSSHIPAPPPAAWTFKQVDVHGHRGWGIRTDDRSVKLPYNGQLGPWFTTQASIGYYHACFVTNGKVWCEENPVHRTECHKTVPPVAVKQISVGMCYTCAIKPDSKLACWGYNASGQASPPQGLFKQISAGESHACGVKLDNSVACWGRNSRGQVSGP